MPAPRKKASSDGTDAAGGAEGAGAGVGAGAAAEGFGGAVGVPGGGFGVGDELFGRRLERLRFLRRLGERFRRREVILEPQARRVGFREAANIIRLDIVADQHFDADGRDLVRR